MRGAEMRGQSHIRICSMSGKVYLQGLVARMRASISGKVCALMWLIASLLLLYCCFTTAVLLLYFCQRPLSQESEASTRVLVASKNR